MKSFKILIAAVAVSALLFSGCKKEVFTGIDSTKAGVTDFAYDATMSSPTSVSLTWDPTQALAAGATSFSVQLAQKEDFSDVDMYEPSIGQTVQADAKVNDGVVFSGLKEYTRYYARVRANYPRSIFSDWTILKMGEDLAVISVGHGPMTMTFGAPASLDLTAPSYSRILANWAVVGKADGYAPEWKKSSDSNWNVLPETANANVEINDLEATTKYDVRVRSFRDNDGTKEYSDYVTASITTPEKPAFSSNIETAEQFITFISTIAATAGKADAYTLEKDIDLGGADVVAAESFGGQFDGKGHVIKNAVLPNNLFNTVSGTFSNVKFDAVKIDNSVIGTVAAGGAVSGVEIANSCTVSFAEPVVATNYGTLVNSNYGTVENCTNNARIELSYAALPSKEECNWGGLVGYTEGQVKGCTNGAYMSITVDAPASGTFHTFGGVVGMYSGEAGKSVVIDCTNTGEVSVEYATAVYFFVGGVVGGSPSAASTPGNYGVIEGCTNEGAVSIHYIKGGSGAYPNIGGVVGYTEGQVKGCTNKGNITLLCDSTSSTWTCARAAGVGGTVTMGASDCHNYGKLSLTALFAGGTAGNRGAGNIATCCIGGVIGSAGPYVPDGSVVFEKCTNETALDIDLNTTTETPNHHVGGVFGYVTGVIKDCANNANVTCTSPTAINRLGGIAGGCMYAVEGCSNTAALKVIHPAITKTDWVTYIGGIVGDASTADKVTYTKCVNSGDINFESTATISTNRTSALGGIIGCSKKGEDNVSFAECSNTGKFNYTSPGNTVTGELQGGQHY
ncbi:MAG: fibronectin type III domain-containing protein [Bacteroidales bacterium]|nr:fibronectin type III domain-containing protein [Bacteroidales bacterium]